MYCILELLKITLLKASKTAESTNLHYNCYRVKNNRHLIPAQGGKDRSNSTDCTHP